MVLIAGGVMVILGLVADSNAVVVIGLAIIIVGFALTWSNNKP